MFTMRYRKQCVTALFMFLTLPACAMSWPEYLRINMLQAYDNLNLKVEQCAQMRQTIEKQDVPSTWFNELSNEQKKAAVLLLSQMTMDKCIAEKEAEYSRTLLAYVAETGDSQRLDDWLTIKKVFRHREQQEAFESLDLRQIQILLDTKPFNKPFDPLQVSELYN